MVPLSEPVFFIAVAEARDKAILPPFKPLRWAEKLLRLRRLNYEGFMSKTSEATRNTLLHYEVWKKSAAKGDAGR